MSDVKTIKTIVFNGTPESFNFWSAKFKAQANRHGYKKLLMGNETVPTEAQYNAALRAVETQRNDADVSAHKATIKRYEKNEEAVEQLILSIDSGCASGRAVFNLVKNSQSTDHPEGNCKVIWDKLVAKYEPKSTPSLLKIRKEFANNTLDAGMDPCEWIAELEDLMHRSNAIGIATEMKDIDLLVHALNNMPDEYDSVVDGMEGRLELPDSDPKKLTIEDLRDKLSSHYQRLTDRHTWKENKYEKVLMAINDKAYSTISQGDLYKLRHELEEISKKTGKDDEQKYKKLSGKTSVKCHFCGKRGHKMKDCWELEKARKGANLPSERGAMALDVESHSDESYDELGF